MYWFPAAAIEDHRLDGFSKRNALPHSSGGSHQGA